MKMKIQLKNINTKSEQRKVYMPLLNGSLNTVKMPNISKLVYTLNPITMRMSRPIFLLCVSGRRA